MLALAAVVMLIVSTVPASAHGRATQQTASVHAFPTGPDGIEPQDGSARLVRTDSGLSFRMRTDSLTPGDVVTVWYVIFNNPSACNGGCDGSDLGNPNVGGTVMWAAGSIVGGNGTANWAGHLSVGELTVAHPGFVFSDQTLTDARGAEIHLVVHSHGEARPGYISDQLHSFWTEGDTLKDQQAAAFPGSD